MMGYALLAKMDDGARRVVARRRVLSEDPRAAMFYAHPSAARVCADALRAKTPSVKELRMVPWKRAAAELARWDEEGSP